MLESTLNSAFLEILRYKYFVLTFVCLHLNITNGLAQKNSISIEHSTILSKLQFEEKITDFYERNTGRFSYLYGWTEMNQPLITSSIRISYKRNISKKIQIGIWGRKLTRGLRGAYSFNITSIQDTAALSDTYGGFDLVYRLKSFETGLSVEYEIFTNKVFSFCIGLKPALDVYDILEIKTNVLNRLNGVISPTGDEQRHFNSGIDKFFERYKDHLKRDFYRGSLYFSGIMEYQTIVPNLSFTTSIEIGGSTPLKTNDPAPLSFLPDGWIFLSSIQFGVAYTL